MAAPELRLDVRLNLATFRTDLGKAAQAAAAYYYPVNLLINKQNLTKQLTAIGRSLGTTKYNIDLNDTSVVLAADKVDKLAASLKKLSGSIQIDFNAGGGAKTIGTAMKEMAAKLAKDSKGDINKAVEQMVGMRGASPFGSGTRSVAGFKSAAKGMGLENAFKLFFQELKQVDPQSLKRALDDGSVMMMQENRELKQKLDKVQSSAESAAQDLRTMGETVTAAGGKLKASLTTGGKTLYPQNYGLKIASLLSQVEKLDKDLRRLSPLAGAELTSDLAGLSRSLNELSGSFLGLTGITESLDDTLGNFQRMVRTASAATSAYTERITRRGGMEIASQAQRFLPSSPPLAGLLRPSVSFQEKAQAREAVARARGDVEFGPRTAGESRPITEDPRVAIFRQLLEQRDERDRAVFAELAKLRDVASRRLPAGAVAEIGTTAQDQAVRNFYNALREGTIRIQRATQQLLTGTQLSGLLPSREMIDQRKFAAAIQKAVVVDMQNALRFEAQKKMLPAAGETAFASNMRQSLQGSIFRAPAISGRGNATIEERQERDRSVRAAQARRRSEERSAQILEADDRRRASIRALLDAETAQELRDAASRRQSLREGAERLLPAGIPAIADQGAQSAVVEQFYTSMRAAQQMLERNFSANSYLPQATRALAASMMQASASIKALPAARGARGALPSTEMMETLRFQRAIAKSVQMDMENALRQQMQGRMLPAAGRTSYRSPDQIARESEQAASAQIAAKAAREQAGAMIRQIRAELRTPLLPAGPTYPSSPVGSMGRFPMSGIAGRGSMGQFPMDPMLAVGGASAMGQKTAGPYPFSNTARSARGGYFPGISSSLFFPMSGMMGPSSPIRSSQPASQPLQAGRITAQSTTLGGMPPGGGAYGGPGNFGRRGGGSGGGFNGPPLPGAGLVREIGNEFIFATKQVFLFGVAYKALAFLQSFPTQVGAAVGALQSFRNTLNAISPTAADAAASNQLIIDTVDKYNIPIQSARDGFTKLYASMKPAGFSGDQIGDLFLGISKASATLGLSSDKVDRVTYAFSQMASKGQLMSEEVSGQLGDVIPGALSIMAEAANMDIKTFKKAMEDGVFVGKAFEAVMSNVPIVLEKRFGKGAEGAAKTFQGAINNMQTSLTLFYEAFEPVAVGFLNAVVKPITAGLQTLTDGFNAFFTGQAAQTAGGSAFAEQLNNLRPSFEGIQANLAALIPSLQTFGKLLLSVAQFLASVAGNPITGFLLKVYANVLLVNTAFTLLGGRILLGLIANINAAIVRFVAFGYAMNAVGIQTTGANTALAGTQLQMMLLQRNTGAALAPVNALLGSLARMAAIGAIAIAVTIVVNGLTELKDAQDRINRLRGARDPVGPVGPVPIMTAERRYTGATRERVTSDQQKQAEYLAQLRGDLAKLQATQTKAGGALSQTALGNLGNILGGLNRENINAKITETKLLIKNAEEVVNLNPRKFRTAAEQQRVTTSATVSGGGGGGGGGGAKPKEKKERESQIPQLMLQLEKTKELSAVEMQIVNAQLINNTSQLNSLELLKRLIEFKYEAKSLALEDLTTEERALKYREIGLRREQAIFENQLQLQIDLKKERDEIQQGFAATLAGYQEEAGFQQMYLDLINQGVLPSLAKVRVEAAKAFAEGEKKLDQSIEQIQLNIAGLELAMEALKLEKNLTPEKKKQLEADEKRLEILKEDLRLRGLLKDTAPERRGAAIAAGEGTLAPKTASEYAGEGLEAAQDRLKELTNTGYQVVQAANAIGDAFGEAFKGVITGSMTAREALAGMFQSVADHFADMVAQMIAEYLKMALIKGIMSIIGGAAGALGGGLSSGFNAGTSSAIDTGATGWANSFATPLKFANGGITPGGFTAFANGGVVTGPTLGLVGEGRYNEAVIPLPDGKSVPVQLSGGDGGNQVNTNITVNVSNGQAQSNATGSNSSELGRKIEGAVKQVIVGELRPGGLLASR